MAGKTMKTKVLECLEAGPATTWDITRELFGDDAGRAQMKRVSATLCELASFGVIRRAGRVFPEDRAACAPVEFIWSLKQEAERAA